MQTGKSDSTPAGLRSVAVKQQRAAIDTSTGGVKEAVEGNIQRPTVRARLVPPFQSNQILPPVQVAAEQLSARGVTPTIADARFAKPLDRDLILGLASGHEVLITIEEGAVGGFGSHVSQMLADEGVFDNGLKFRSMVLPDSFIDQANPRDMYDIAGLNAGDIEAKVLEVLGIGVLERRA